jgi:hypothetical protein
LPAGHDQHPQYHQSSEYRSGIGAHSPFLCDPRRVVLRTSTLAEYTDDIIRTENAIFKLSANRINSTGNPDGANAVVLRTGCGWFCFSQIVF